MVPQGCFASSVGKENALHPAYRQAGPTAPLQEVLKGRRTPAATPLVGKMSCRRLAAGFPKNGFWPCWVAALFTKNKKTVSRTLVCFRALKTA